ncbi:MAG: GDP-mannose 4,6-dehydratase, partial [Patescibacteria group bacterium]
ESMWKILQYKNPDDFVIATGEGHTIKDLCQVAFDYVGLDWKDYVVTNPKWVRPTETGPLIGNAAKARKLLNWKPKTSFKQLIEMMVESDLSLLR